MSDVVYAGPARHEPLAVELHNTLYVAGGKQIDGLAHGASASDVILAAIATDAIDLITSSRLTGLRACGAPGCVLLFVKDHPRREWCSAACGNRARQARHYARTKDRLRPT